MRKFKKGDYVIIRIPSPPIRPNPYGHTEQAFHGDVEGQEGRIVVVSGMFSDLTVDVEAWDEPAVTRETYSYHPQELRRATEAEKLIYVLTGNPYPKV